MQSRGKHMKKCIYILSTLLLHTVATYCTTERPLFATPVHLFAERNLGEIVAKQHPEIDPKITEWLATPEAREILHQASSDPVKREVGHQASRKEVYSGQQIHPNTIVLLSSGKATLKETVHELQSRQLAHNFIIDINGAIHPITQEGESIEEALTHRPFSVGISGTTLDGFLQCRDMNSRSISICLVGKDNQEHTAKQRESLISLVKWLQSSYNIQPKDVKHYGAITYPYSTPENPLHGRRAVTPHVPIKELADHNLALWPKQEELFAIQQFTSSASLEDIVHWTSGALRKIGFICPDTHRNDHPDFQAALRKFQQLYQHREQDGKLNIQSLIDLNSLLLQHEEQNKYLHTIWPRPKSIEPIREIHDLFDRFYNLLDQHESTYIRYYTTTIYDL